MMANLVVFPNKSAIKEEAGAWIVRIDCDDLNEAEWRELKKWMRRSDFHRDYLLKLAANWDAMGLLQELGQMFPMPEAEMSATEGATGIRLLSWLRKRFRSSSIVMARGFSVMLVAVVATFVVTPGLFGTSDELMTAVGERRSYILDDGTVVTLNTNTRLQLDYSDARRAVTLIEGEASFDVAKNPEKPFVVYAGSGLVWAVGTAFNVRHDSGLVNIIVTEGRVKVFSDANAKEPVESESVAGDPHSIAVVQSQDDIHVDIDSALSRQREALLSAGESIRYRQLIEVIKPIDQEEAERKLSWRNGALVFKGETLEQAVAEISRYTDKKLVISDASLRSLRVGGHYKTDDIDALISSLGQGLGVSVTYADSDRVVLSENKNISIN